MNDPPQYYGEPATVPAFARPSDRAVYHVRPPGGVGEPVAIAVECVEGGGNVPRNATNLRQVARDVAKDFNSEFQSVVAIAESVVESLSTLKPGEVEVEFGVELGGELGIPMVTKGEAKANFKVTLRWVIGSSP